MKGKGLGESKKGQVKVKLGVSLAFRLKW